MIKTAHDLYTEHFLWKQSAYEYVFDKNPFDVVCGTDKIRKQIESDYSFENIVNAWQGPLDEFKTERQIFLLY
jgi:uncharacterized protein YbbC (DUF1343 family)